MSSDLCLLLLREITASSRLSQQTFACCMMLRVSHVNGGLAASSRRYQQAAHGSSSGLPARPPPSATAPHLPGHLQPVAGLALGSSHAFTNVPIRNSSSICHASSSSGSDRDPYVAAGRRLQSLINGVGWVLHGVGNSAGILPMCMHACWRACLLGSRLHSAWANSAVQQQQCMHGFQPCGTA